MKITKRQLKRIIKEERTKLLSEASPEATEGEILANFSIAMDRIEKLKDEMYGMFAPGQEGMNPAGDKLAEQMQMEIENLDTVYRQLNAYFEHGAPK